MIEALVALVITVGALGWIGWRVWHYRPRNRTRLAIVIVLMVLVAYAVEAYLPDRYSLRAQLWFGAVTAVLMAVATYVETEPKPK
jgi:hypothetical protein